MIPKKHIEILMNNKIDDAEKIFNNRSDKDSKAMYDLKTKEIEKLTIEINLLDSILRLH